MSITNEHDATGFAAQLGLPGYRNVSSPRAIAIGIVVTWGVLLALTLIAGTAYGDKVSVPFLLDHGPHGRYLLALPLLLAMGTVLSRRAALAAEQLGISGVVPARYEERLKQTIATVGHAWHNRFVGLAIIVFAYAGVLPSFMRDWENHISIWMYEDPSAATRLTPAGVWNLFVCAPFVRALILHNLWKLFVWTWFLSRLARWDLKLNALHPDQRFGLNFLGETQVSFAPVVAALGIQLGSFIVVEARLDNAPLASFYPLIAVFVALQVALVFGPLLLFVPQARRAGVQAQLAFETWGSHAATYLSSRLFGSTREQVAEQLNSAEISSLTDATALFDRARSSLPIPTDLRSLITIALAAILPMSLPLLTLLPLRSLLQKLMGIVF